MSQAAGGGQDVEWIPLLACHDSLNQMVEAGYTLLGYHSEVAVR